MLTTHFKLVSGSLKWQCITVATFSLLFTELQQSYCCYFVVAVFSKYLYKYYLSVWRRFPCCSTFYTDSFLPGRFRLSVITVKNAITLWQTLMPILTLNLMSLASFLYV